jgi:hypothetical protein
LTIERHVRFAFENISVEPSRHFFVSRELWRRRCAANAKPIYAEAFGAVELRGAERRQQEKKMAKAQRRGNREARKPKAIKAPVAAPAAPFAVKGASVATSPPKRKG